MRSRGGRLTGTRPSATVIRGPKPGPELHPRASRRARLQFTEDEPVEKNPRDQKDGAEGQLLDELVEQLDRTRKLLTEGPEGAQYRSAIWTTTDEQKKVTDAYIAQLDAAKAYPKSIVTKVGPLHGFYPAEAYHQDYLTLLPNQPYIAYNDIPKVENLKKLFAENYTEKPTLVGAAKVTN